eukprot:scaffold13_cov241-Pinguiococcus_pyrenoidosus.AAC.17
MPNPPKRPSLNPSPSRGSAPRPFGSGGPDASLELDLVEPRPELPLARAPGRSLRQQCVPRGAQHRSAAVPPQLRARRVPGALAARDHRAAWLRVGLRGELG